MKLASLVHQYLDAFKAKYSPRLWPIHLDALEAILRCRTADAGELYVACTECSHTQWRALPCGHRSCPQCQNHEVSQWLARQQAKRLPVTYFLVTFTLPYELRAIAWHNPTRVYNLLFTCAADTLKDFGLNPNNLGASIGLTAILHTHTRRLDYHPHLHVVVPGGGVDKARQQWKKLNGKFLFNEFALAKVFRARFLTAMTENKLPFPDTLPDKWVVDCKAVGTGKTALQYLSRYLYRGVISESHIIANENGQVTFEYTDSRTAQRRTRSLNGEDFLWLVLQHVLPKGFRRARDYGFLHGNAKKTLALVQLILQVIINAETLPARPVFECPHCRAPMAVLTISRPDAPSG